eukprot:scaffold12330_cov83-Skeletonema_marinoi.AAC.9
MGGILEGNVMMMPGGQTMAIPDTVQSDTGMPQVLVRWGMPASFLVEQLPEDVVGMLEKILQDIKAAVMTTHNIHLKVYVPRENPAHRRRYSSSVGGS